MEGHSLEEKHTWEGTIDCQCRFGPPTQEKAFVTCSNCNIIFHKACIFGTLLEEICFNCSGLLVAGFGNDMTPTDDNLPSRQLRERKPGQLKPFTAPTSMDKQYAAVPLVRRRKPKRTQDQPAQNQPAQERRTPQEGPTQSQPPPPSTTRSSESDDSDIPLAQAKRSFLHQDSTPEAITNERRGIICNCPEENDPLAGDVDDVICQNCAARQHRNCMTSEDTKYALCNACNLTKAHQLLLNQNDRIEQTLTEIARKRAEADHLYHDVLWRYYCSLPDGEAKPALLRLTEMKFERRQGRMVPVHTAPEFWVEEIQERLANVMNTAGPEVTNHFMSSGVYKNEKILVPWRELAVHMVNTRRYDRNELGLFAELLGLEWKGTYWSGGAL